MFMLSVLFLLEPSVCAAALTCPLTWELLGADSLRMACSIDSRHCCPRRWRRRSGRTLDAHFVRREDKTQKRFESCRWGRVCGAGGSVVSSNECISFHAVFFLFKLKDHARENTFIFSLISAWITHPAVLNMLCTSEDAEDNVECWLCPIMHRTCSLCLRELEVDDVRRLDQRPAGLDHLEDKENVHLISITSQYRTGGKPKKALSGTTDKHWKYTFLYYMKYRKV